MITPSLATGNVASAYGQTSGNPVHSVGGNDPAFNLDSKNFYGEISSTSVGGSRRSRGPRRGSKKGFYKGRRGRKSLRRRRSLYRRGRLVEGGN